jgi:hypothetical protein
MHGHYNGLGFFPKCFSMRVANPFEWFFFFFKIFLPKVVCLKSYMTRDKEWGL